MHGGNGRVEAGNGLMFGDAVPHNQANLWGVHAFGAAASLHLHF